MIVGTLLLEFAGDVDMLTHAIGGMLSVPASDVCVVASFEESIGRDPAVVLVVGPLAGDFEQQVDIWLLRGQPAPTLLTAAALMSRALRTAVMIFDDDDVNPARVLRVGGNGEVRHLTIDIGALDEQSRVVITRWGE